MTETIFSESNICVRFTPETGTIHSDAAGNRFSIRPGTIKPGPEVQPSVSEVKRSPPSNILVIDDHPLATIGLEALFQKEPDFEVRGSARSADELSDELKRNPPDLFIVDFAIEMGNGLGEISQLVAAYSSSEILVYSACEEAFYGERVLQCGAKGYLMKSESPELIVEAARKILRGEFSISNRLQTILLSPQPGESLEFARAARKLTDRELSMVYLIGEGKSSGEIADLFKISLKTVEANRLRIREKLYLKNSTDLIHFAIQVVDKQRSA